MRIMSGVWHLRYVCKECWNVNDAVTHTYRGMVCCLYCGVSKGFCVCPCRWNRSGVRFWKPSTYNKGRWEINTLEAEEADGTCKEESRAKDK